MRPQPLESRVEALETRVIRLEELPARIDRLETQIVQLRDENRAEHSAIREEIAQVRSAVHTTSDELRTHMRVLFEEAVGRIAAIGETGPKSRKRKR
jgi:predicted  nucleic acid-binding Zn-ribbon protein